MKSVFISVHQWFTSSSRWLTCRPLNFLVRSCPLLAVLALSPVASAQTEGKARYDHGNPTDWEQLALELVNRARARPEDEARRLGLALNDGLGPHSISPEPKPPLAFHPDLLRSARRHSRWMLDENTFSHTGRGGSTAGDRMAEAGYLFLMPYLWGENIGWQGLVGPARPETLVRRIHRNLFASPSHRLNMLDPEHDETGIGLQSGDFSFQGSVYRALMLTENFARSAGSPVVDGPFLLGVLYADHNGNGSYDPGEGRKGVTITTEPGTYYALTSASGGYALPLGNLKGKIAVHVTGGGLPPEVLSVDLPEGRNLKLDVVEPGPAAHPPPERGRRATNEQGKPGA